MATSATSPSIESPAGELPRAIGTLGATALVVGTIIGSGIFLVPHDVAGQVGSTGTMLAVWVGGGALSFAGALSLAESGAAVPEALRQPGAPKFGRFDDVVVDRDDGVRAPARRGRVGHDPLSTSRGSCSTKR